MDDLETPVGAVLSVLVQVLELGFQVLMTVDDINLHYLLRTPY